jgi:hypothetical protein
MADTRATSARLAAVPSDPPCDLAHVGSDWRWHDNPRGGHWDHWERSGDDGHWEWRHYWRDDQRCNGDGDERSGSDQQSDS